MYSIVLLAALTTGANAPDCWFGSCYYGCACAYGYGYYGWGGCGCRGWGGYGCGCYSPYGSNPCWGSYYGGGCCNWGTACGPVWGSYDCFGGHGGFSDGGAIVPSTAPPTPGAEQIPPPKIEDKKSTSLDRARLNVRMPADAKLFVDDLLIPTKTAQRHTFSTPRLDRGQTYFYEVRAEVIRDGKPVQESRRVLVRAGEEINVSFSRLESPIIAATSPRR